MLDTRSSGEPAFELPEGDWPLEPVEEPPPPAAAEVEDDEPWLDEKAPRGMEGTYLQAAPQFGEVLPVHAFCVPDEGDAVREALQGQLHREPPISRVLCASAYQADLPRLPYPRVIDARPLVHRVTAVQSSAQRIHSPSKIALADTARPVVFTTEPLTPVGAALQLWDETSVPVLLAARAVNDDDDDGDDSGPVVAVAAVAASLKGLAHGVIDAAVETLEGVVAGTDLYTPLGDKRRALAIRGRMLAAVGPNPVGSRQGYASCTAEYVRAIFFPWTDRSPLRRSRRCMFVHDIEHDYHLVMSCGWRQQSSTAILAQRAQGVSVQDVVDSLGIGPDGMSDPDAQRMILPPQNWYVRTSCVITERLRYLGVGQVEMTRRRVETEHTDELAPRKHVSFVMRVD